MIIQKSYITEKEHLDHLLLTREDWHIFFNGIAVRVAQLFVKTYSKGKVDIRLEGGTNHLRVNTLNIFSKREATCNF